MNVKKIAAACVIVAAASVGTYGYVTWEPKPKVVEPVVTEVALEASPVITEIPKTPYPQSTRVTGRVVYVSPGGGSLGSGVVIDSRTVLTIAHVVKDQKMMMVDVGRAQRKWVPAIVVGRIHAVPEDIVILKLTGPEYFLQIDHFKRGPGIPLPMMMVTPKGAFAWNPGAVVPGDSGGAVLNIDGELIGLVVGYKIVGKEGVAAIFR